MGETRRLYQGGKKRSQAAKARRAAAAPKPRTQESINKEAAGRKAYAERGSTRKSRADKRAERKAAKTQRRPKKAKKAKKAKKSQRDQGKGGPGSSGFSMPSLPDLPELPELPELPGVPDLSNGFGNSDPGNVEEPVNTGAEGEQGESAEEAAAADQAAADSVDPADFGAQPPPYNAETCENQTNYESEKCLAIQNSRAFRDPLFQEYLKVAPDNIDVFFKENAEAIMKAYNEIGSTFRECLQAVEAKKNDCLACANGDQSKCPEQAATTEGGTRRRMKRRSRLKTHRRS